MEQRIGDRLHGMRDRLAATQGDLAAAGAPCARRARTAGRFAVGDVARIVAFTIVKDEQQSVVPWCRSCRAGSTLVPPVEVPKRVPRRRMTRWLSWANVVEVQVDLEGRMQPRTAPLRDACRSRLTCRSADHRLCGVCPWRLPRCRLSAIMKFRV
jgi:hypothetical protein